MSDEQIEDLFKQAQAPPPHSAGGGPPPPVTGPDTKLAWKIPAALFVIVVLFGLVLFKRPESTQPAADRAKLFLEHVGQGRIGPAYGLLSPDFRKNITMPKFEETVRADTVWLVDQANVTGASIEGEVCTVTLGVVSTYGDEPKSYTAIVQLKKSGGDWMVDAVRFQ